LIPGHLKGTPLLCDWETFSKAPNTFHNTPACYSIYMCGLNLEYMNEQGGISVLSEKAKQRSEMLYGYIDGSEGYY